MVCSPDISMSYNVITNKHDSERITEAGTLKGNNETIIWVRENWKCQTSDLMLLSKYKRKPEAWNKHVVLYLKSEATSLFANTAHPFRLIPWLLELDSGRHWAFFIVQLLHPHMTTWKTTALTRWTFVAKVMSLLFNMLSRLVITFLPRSKRFLI